MFEANGIKTHIRIRLAISQPSSILFLLWTLRVDFHIYSTHNLIRNFILLNVQCIYHCALSSCNMKKKKQKIIKKRKNPNLLYLRQMRWLKFICYNLQTFSFSFCKNFIISFTQCCEQLNRENKSENIIKFNAILFIHCLLLNPRYIRGVYKIFNFFKPFI